MAKIIDLKEENIVHCHHCDKIIKYEDCDLKSPGILFEGAFSTIVCPNCGRNVAVWR